MLNILPMKASQDDSLKTDSAASATGVMAQSKDGVICFIVTANQSGALFFIIANKPDIIYGLK